MKKTITVKGKKYWRSAKEMRAKEPVFSKDITDAIAKAFSTANAALAKFEKMDKRALRERLLECEEALAECDSNYSHHYWAKYLPVTPV